MSVFDVSLEVDTSGVCMAHVLDLPGCCTRASGQESALAALPDAIRAYYGWLRRHGDDVPTPTAIEFRVVETSAGFGPFARGDRAALFAYDRAPLSRSDLEVYLRRAAYARGDLLALVRDLPNHILDWRADTLTIREILRHIGNTEQFYVSRLVDPATLPPEWAGDEHMPIFAFLELQRRTVVQRLLALTDDELAATTYQPRWTEHPDEPWSARKALRRLREHEREHIDQVRAILADWRRHLPARMAAERAALLWPLIGLDEATLTQATVFDQLTAKDLLAHIAAWDELFAERAELILNRHGSEIISVDLSRNDAVYAERRRWSLAQPWAQVWSDLHATRQELLAILSALSQDELTRSFPSPRIVTPDASPYSWVLIWLEHDREHAAALRAALGLVWPKRLLHFATSY